MKINNFFELIKNAQYTEKGYNELEFYLQKKKSGDLNGLLNNSSGNAAESLATGISPIAFAIENGFGKVVSLLIHFSPHPACLARMTDENSLLKLIDNPDLNKYVLSETIKTILNSPAKDKIPETVIVGTAKSLIIRMIQLNENECPLYNELLDSIIACTNYEWNTFFLACVFAHIKNSPLIHDDNNSNEFKIVIAKWYNKFSHHRTDHFAFPEFHNENINDFNKLCRVYGSITIKLINEKKPKLLNTLFQYKIYIDHCISAIYNALYNLIFTEQNVNHNDVLKIMLTILHHEYGNYIVGFEKTPELFDRCLKYLKNNASNEFVHIVFDFLIERDFVARIPKDKATQAIDFYQKKYHTIILEQIKNNNIDGLITLVQSKKTNNHHRSKYFKKVINSTHIKGLTAMDLAINSKNKKLVALLQKCNFDDNPRINHKNNSVNILKKLILENPDEKKLGLIWTVFHNAKSIKMIFIQEIINYCFNFIHDPILGLFYNPVLDCVTALPQKNTILTQLIFGIHVIRSDVSAFHLFVNDYLISNLRNDTTRTASIALRHIMELPFFGKFSSIEFVIQQNDTKMLEALLHYHPTIAITENDHEQIPLLSLLEDIATNKTYQNRQKKYQMAKIIVENTYIKRIIEINGEFFSTERVCQAKNFSMVTDQIIHYALDHLFASDDRFFSELVTIIFENHPDLVHKIMSPINLVFQKSVSSKKINKLFYCDSLFAAAAIKRNISLHDALLKFISPEEQSQIPNHQFFSLSSATKIAVLINNTKPELIAFPKNSRFLLLYQNKNDLSLICHFFTTDISGLRINEEKFLIDRKWTYCFHEISSKMPKNILEKRFHAVLNDFHELHAQKLGELIEHDYYAGVTVKKSLLSLEEKEQLGEEDYIIPRPILVASPDQNELICSEKQKQLHGNNQYILVSSPREMNASLTEDITQKERYIDNSLL